MITQAPNYEEAVAELNPPDLAHRLPWRAIVRALSEPGEASVSPGVVLGAAEQARDMEPPEPTALRELELYARRVYRFARRYLLNCTWGPRAVHESVRTGKRLSLPHGPASLQPQALIPPSNSARTGLLRGDRAAAWRGAVATVQTRLAGAAVDDADLKRAHRARHYLEAAVSGVLKEPGEKWEPVVATDQAIAAYEQGAAVRGRKYLVLVRLLPLLRSRYERQ